MQLISRKDAKASGLSRYFTGKPCHRGHICSRFTKNHGCVECELEGERRRYHANLEKSREKSRNLTRKHYARRAPKAKEYRERNKEKIAAYNARYRLEKPEVCKSASINWRKNNVDRCKEQIRSYTKRNYAAILAKNSERRAIHKKATPRWADKKAIAEIFAKAEELTIQIGTEMTVDHIVPLRSKLVCGLHWHENMQVITKSENSAKGNRWWPDMP